MKMWRTLAILELVLAGIGMSLRPLVDSSTAINWAVTIALLLGIALVSAVLSIGEQK